MTQAQYWLLICDTRSSCGARSLSRDGWCRRLLSEVAGPATVTRYCDTYHATSTGYDGLLWKFDDGSTLVANSEGAFAQ